MDSGGFREMYSMAGRAILGGLAIAFALGIGIGACAKGCHYRLQVVKDTRP